MNKPRESRSKRYSGNKTAVTALATVPLNFLLGCSQQALGDFELARLAEVSKLRAEMHSVFDRLIDQMSQSALAGWFRQTDTVTLRHALENPVDVMLWAQEQIRNQGRNEQELVPLTSLTPGAAHLAAALRYQERNVANGLCSVCPKPLSRNSVKFCDRHLAMQRARYKPKNAKGERPGSIDWLYSGVFESSQGKQPGTLKALANARETYHRSGEAEKALYERIAAQFGVTPHYVRAVALGQRRSKHILAALKES